MDQAHLSALALTLHVALACEDQVDCVATNVAGDELASLRVSAKLPLAEVRRRLAAEIGVVDVQVKLLLPAGGDCVCHLYGGARGFGRPRLHLGMQRSDIRTP